ncbi:LOW QUALITY PROTEIN: leucine-rich repeat and IQ domain-containing protein 1 [Anoplopoma fimbria]|uniref:LOW QUALITY PROTEIN: leucine-rich repeat and IQ domain-containing protein 1 n=1 Tax=Anoplopoma fimbria TaxID=229290 RepID=UPI0023EAE88F|nr:LOW QUALITY PROTEIN: leucine-rich repeat and IQ domain-containing protein 1 [Anoplopoma fimbria]
MEKEKRKMEEEKSQKEEEERKREEENMRIKEKVRITKEIEERKKQEEMRKNKEEEEEEALKRIHEERRRDEKEHGNEDEEEKEAKKREKETKAMKENKELTEVVRKKEGENRKTIEPGSTEEDEKRKREEEERRRQLEGRDETRENQKKIKLKENEESSKRYEEDNRMMEEESKTKEKKHEEKEDGKNVEEEIRLKETEESRKRVVNNREEEGRKANELQEKIENNRTSSRPGSLQSESTIRLFSTEAKPPQRDPEESISQTSIRKTLDYKYQAARPSPVCLPEQTEKKRLAWMKDCVPWSKLSLQNRSKQKGSVRSRRGLRGAAGSSSLPPLCPDSLLQSTAWKSLQEVTTVTLQDLPGCSLSTLAQCSLLRSLTLRRCGLKSLEGINQLPQLCYVDVQENDISYVDCDNMSSLRVLQLGRNKLTSIHGLTGAENVDVLDLSHNSITRIAGLESMRRLQRLSVDHNQLISTKGLRDVYTLLHLSCSHNHLASVEGLENSALLNTLDLRANSLTEPPGLNNQVLLRELHLDDNSISSLQGLSACWLPLMQRLSVAQNRITQLPPMSDSVSLANLDLRFNCMSELQNVCESLEGCLFLREVHLTGNPLQQESGWRSTLQKAVPGLRAIDDRQTDSFLTPPDVQQVGPASGSFPEFCQAQLQQTRALQRQHSRELSSASSSLDAVKTSCRHLTEALRLAEDQRFAHEYGDTTVADTHRTAGRTTPEELDNNNAEKHTERPQTESAGKDPQVLPSRSSYWTLEEKSVAESRYDAFEPPKTEPTVSKVISGSVQPSATKIQTTSSRLEVAPVSNNQDLDLQNSAAVMIQQLWRKYRQKCGNISSLSTAKRGGGRGGDGGKPESGPSYVNGSAVGRDYAATVIQALWRGFALRRRLSSALAAVTSPDVGEDDTLEEVDVDEFVFDEAALEKHWRLPFSEDSPPRCNPASEQPLSLKPPGHVPEPSQYILPPPLVWRPKQAWMPGEHVDSAGQRVSPESSNRSKSPASTSVPSSLSQRSEKILEEWGFTDRHTALLMLKRAQKMKPATQRQKKHRDPSIRLAFRNCSYPLGPVEARNRPAQHNRSDVKGCEAELGLQHAEKVERVKREGAQQWMQIQAAHPDRDSESEHFLPEISSDVLNGGRVQLVADPGYTARLHHASGPRANDSSPARPCREHGYPRRNSLGPERNEVPSPGRVASAPSKRDRISHRDNPVQMSGGWGGGKKRDKVYK